MKAMTGRTVHHRNVERRRYRGVHTDASQVFSVHDTAALHTPRVRKLAISRSASYAPSLHVGMTAVSTGYKASRVLWLEGDAAQPAPNIFRDYPIGERRRQIEHGTSLPAKEELVAVLRQYIGSWVAVRGCDVIVSSGSPLAIVSFLREHNLRADSILRVPRNPKQEVGE